MYKVDIDNNSKYIKTFVKNNGDSIFCAVVEANQRDVKAYNESKWYDNIFIEALKFIPANILTKDLPRLMADSIKQALLKFRDEIGPNGVIYAGLSVENKSLYICNAGDCRIHVVNNNTTKFITRDHNLVDDSTHDLKYEDENTRSFYKTIPTRAITLIEMDKSPEFYETSIEEDNKILICSSNFHRYREPNEYVKSFVEEEVTNLPIYKKESGVIIKIQELI